ncbi:MAG: hypothetical protein J7J76_02900 [Candidatus Latescibacteria bacterium]|nr:hypothetical protein [Candidatus Latescibacterota bacterium]
MKNDSSRNDRREKLGTRLFSLILILLVCWLTTCVHSTYPGSSDGRIFVRLDVPAESWPYSRKGYLSIVIQVQGWDPLEKFVFPLEYTEAKELMRELNIKEEDVLNWNRIQGTYTDLTGRVIKGGRKARVTLYEMVPLRLRNTSVTFRVDGDVTLQIYFANLETPYSPLCIRRIH